MAHAAGRGCAFFMARGRTTAAPPGEACPGAAQEVTAGLYGAYRRHRPPRPHGPPRWAARIDNASWVTAAGLAWLLQPWGLGAAGAATAFEANLSTAGDWLALTGYCLLATLSLIVMEMYAVWAPAAANARLTGLRSCLGRHQGQLIVTLSLFAGLRMTASSIYELVA
ncbi:GAP family protein [Streptomyces sp. NPDC088553]|uniref:GAP family protein n=1 Tax=Streptomyces sp. NPDC088553 TaxID=3365864 RepID=UPI003808E2AA